MGAWSEIGRFLWRHRWWLVGLAFPGSILVTLIHEGAHAAAVWVLGGEILQFVWWPPAGGSLKNVPTNERWSMRLIGLDLAWGERNPDGVALLRLSGSSACLEDSCLVRGDEALLDWLGQAAPTPEPALILVDGPIVCPNLTGSRPVDRETHRHFGRYHAGCHPANQLRCPRPSRLAQALVTRYGFRVGWDLKEAPRLLAEVYPHPAMIRLFELDQIVKYKRGPAPAQRREFHRLQALLTSCLTRRFPEVELNPLLQSLLKAPRTKSAEDRLDAFFCALIGLHHVRHHGQQTQVLGDRDTGFLLVPR